MKTIELKWIEDDNHVVAEDAYTGLKDLIDSGVFPDLTAKCEDDTLYITGEKEDLDKAVMKIQKAYAKYGQIMIKEAKNGTTQELRIESFDENVQDIFNHTLADYNKFKSTKERPLNYVKQLNDYRFKFKKFYETAARSDKKLLKPYLDEISNLLDESEIITKIKPVKAKLEEETMIEYAKEICEAAGKKVTPKDTIVNPENVNTIDDVTEELVGLGYNEVQAKKLVKKYFKKVWRKLAAGECAYHVAEEINDDYINESADNELTKHLGNLKNWGVEEINEDWGDVAREFKDAVSDTVVGGLEKLSPGVQNFIANTIPIKSAIKSFREYHSNFKIVEDKGGKIVLDYRRKNFTDEKYHFTITLKGFRGKWNIHISPKREDWLEDVTVTSKRDLIQYLEAFDYAWNGKRSSDKALDMGWRTGEIAESMNESLSRAAYNKKFNKVAIAYAREMGISVEDAYEELMDNDETPDLIDSVYDVDEIIDKLMNESTEKNMNESFLSPGELKKKLQRVAARWASIQGIKFEDAYNELRRKKSVKDMLDFYSVDEIIDDLSKNKKEVDDELEEEI